MIAVKLESEAQRKRTQRMQRKLRLLEKRQENIPLNKRKAQHSKVVAQPED